MTFYILTLFPEMIGQALHTSIIGKAPSISSKEVNTRFNPY